jgi:hypothetical protein
MDYELFTYRQIFERTLSTDQPKAINIVKLKSEITLEADRILHALLSNTAKLHPSKTQQYIHQHQHAIELILEELDEPLEAPSESRISNQKHQILDIFYTTSKNLILQLQRHFPDQFNSCRKIPALLLKKAKEDIEQKTSHLFKTINALNAPEDGKEPADNIEEELHTILFEHRSLTYQQREYMELFIDQLTGKTEQAQHSITIMDILLDIISLNYNHPLFYHFCCRYFTREIERCEELSAQYSTLNFIKKCIKQTYPSIKPEYSPDQAPIGQSLVRYIKTEMEYLQSMDKIGAHLHQHGLLDERYKVTFTVKQLAIFIHLQVEANIIIAETPKLLHEYISGHYSTNETDRISAKSFKNAYYSASTDDLEKVIDKIVTMLATAQEKL